jgi:hypothetical protein
VEDLSTRGNTSRVAFHPEERVLWNVFKQPEEKGWRKWNANSNPVIV